MKERKLKFTGNNSEGKEKVTTVDIGYKAINNSALKRNRLWLVNKRLRIGQEAHQSTHPVFKEIRVGLPFFSLFSVYLFGFCRKFYLLGCNEHVCCQWSLVILLLNDR